MLRRCVLVAIIMSALGGLPGRAASTINTTQPANGQPYNPAVIRQNFQAAASDVNALDTMNAGASAPSAPGLGTLWLNTSTTTYVLNVYVPASRSWVPMARIDSTTGLWVPPVGGGVLPSIVSAATTDLGSVPQAALNITGSQSIASFGASAPPGQVKFLIFTGSPTLIYNATFMILPNGSNQTLAPGQSLIAISLGGGAWRVGLGASSACAIATTIANGCVHPDGTTITIDPSGQITAPSGAGTVTNVTFTGDGTVLSSTPSAPVTTVGTLLATLNNQAANQILAGPLSGSSATPTFRALVGADLPFPAPSSLGGVESLAVASHQFLTGISTLGVPSAAQPACGDLSNAGALCPLGIGTNLSSGGGNLNVATATASVLGVVKPDGTTIGVSAGTISCATATVSQIGCARPDGTTITISGGVLTATGGGGGGCGVLTARYVCYGTGTGTTGDANFEWDPTGQSLSITSVSALGNLGAIGIKLTAGNTNELGGLQIQEVGGSGSLINMGIEDNLDSNGIRGYINVIGGTGGTFGNLSLIPGGISNHCVAVAHDANGACTFSGFGDAGALLVEGTQGPGKPVVLLDQNGVRFWMGTQSGSSTNDGLQHIYNHDGHDIVDLGGSTTAHGGFLNLNNASTTSIILLDADSTVLNYINATIAFGADVRMTTLPTSCGGKVTGTLWNNSNVINVCP